MESPEPVSPASADRLLSTVPPEKLNTTFIMLKIFIKSFFCISWDDHMAFILFFVSFFFGFYSYWLICRYWCKQHLWDKSLRDHDVRYFECIIGFCFGYYFVADFCICVHQWYWPVTICCVMSLSGCGISIWLLASRNVFRSIPPAAIFGIVSEE